MMKLLIGFLVRYSFRCFLLIFIIAVLVTACNKDASPSNDIVSFIEQPTEPSERPLEAEVSTIDFPVPTLNALVTPTITVAERTIRQPDATLSGSIEDIIWLNSELFAVLSDGKITFFSSVTREQLHQITPGIRITSMAYDPRLHAVVVGLQDGSIHVLHADTGKFLSGEVVHRLASIDLLPHPIEYGAYYSLGSDGHLVKISISSSAAAGTAMQIVQEKQLSVNQPIGLASSSDATSIAVISTKRIELINSRELSTTLLIAPGSTATFIDGGFAQRDQAIIASNNQGTLQVFSTFTGNRIETIPPGDQVGRITMGFSLDKRYLVTGDSRGRLHLWESFYNVETGGVYLQSALSLDGHTQQISSTSFSPDFKYLVSGDISGVLQVWDLREEQP